MKFFEYFKYNSPRITILRHFVEMFNIFEKLKKNRPKKIFAFLHVIRSNQLINRKKYSWVPWSDSTMYRRVSSLATLDIFQKEHFTFGLFFIRLKTVLGKKMF